LYDYGFPMGPFAMSDLAGLDISWKIRKVGDTDFVKCVCTP
jgi:3-hydroxyacyl-CoA dehydrogenase